MPISLLVFVSSVALPGAPTFAGPGESCDFPRYGWTRTVGHPRFFSEAVVDVAIDPLGNALLGGWYKGLRGDMVDFDPTPGVDLHPCRGIWDIFITKLGPDGSYRWTRTIAARGMEFPNGVAAAPDGSIYVTGLFGYPRQVGYVLDFDPTQGVDEHTTVADADIFLTKLNADGSYGWTHTFGHSGTDRGYGVATDARGDVLMTGEFGGTIDFDPGEGVDEHTAVRSLNLFLSRFHGDGSYAWTIDAGDGGKVRPYGVDVGSDGSIALAGKFSGRADFNPGPGVDLHDSGRGNNVFVTKIAGNGSYLWTQTFGGNKDSHEALALGVAMDRRGAVWTCGVFTGTVDFDPGPGVYERTDPRDGGIFVSKFKGNGDWLWSWVPQNSPEDDWGYGIALDRRGNAYITGEFSETVDFNPEGGGDRRTSHGGGDVFVTQLRRDGSYGWTATVGAGGLDRAHGIAVDPDGRIQIGGQFRFTVDFDPTEGVDYHSMIQNSDLFTSRWLCGGCDAVYSHNVEGKRGKIRSTLTTAAPGGKGKIKCKGENGKKTRKARLDDTGRAQVKLRNLPPGNYRCTIHKLRDANGESLCSAPASPRRATVK